MGAFDQYPPQIRAILEKVADAGYQDVLLDEDTGNRYVFNAMTTSTDATVREIGEQLSDGALNLQQLARADSYRETLAAGLADLARLDPEQMSTELDASLPAVPKESPPHEDRGGGDQR